MGVRQGHPPPDGPAPPGLRAEAPPRPLSMSASRRNGGAMRARHLAVCVTLLAVAACGSSSTKTTTQATTSSTSGATVAPVVTAAPTTTGTTAVPHTTPSTTAPTAAPATQPTTAA